MVNIILECADYHCPTRQMKIRENSPSWLSKEIIEELYYKDDLYKVAYRSGKTEDWALFRNQNKRVKKLILEAKEEYTKDILAQNEGNPRKFWRCVNEITGLGRNKKGKSIGKIIDENGTEFQNSEAAEFMNKYYTEAGPKLAEKIHSQWEPTDCLKNIKTLFEFDFISEIWVQKLVQEIKTSKSSAIDELSSKLLKDAFSVLIVELTYLYNTCVETCIFPTAWSIGKISPIPKTNYSSTLPKNWRPITQIPLPGKLLERVLHDQIYKYLEHNGLLYNQQYGFRKKHSTTKAIFDVLKNLYDKWNEKMYTGCIFVDFSKAFETINHSILLEKLKLYGFKSNSLKLMTSYITTRTQITKVNDHVSSSRFVKCGTAQGSILGPLIYILYVNDVLKQMEDSQDIYLYADDMLIMSSNKNVENMMLSLQNKMNTIYSWCKMNKLTINESKTKYMIVSNNHVETIRTISIAGKTLGRVTQYEYLGMLMEEKLNMDKQIESMYKRANKKLGIMTKIRMFITCETASKIYKTMIRPLIEYVDFVIDSGSKCQISKLDRFQERALRRIEYCKKPENRKTYVELEKLYKIENLHVRRDRSLLGQMFFQSKDDINRIYNKCERVLRSSKRINLKYKFSHLTKIHNSPFYRGVKLWNGLPVEIQNCKVKSEFKKMLKRR